MTYSQLVRHKCKRRVRFKKTRTPDLRRCPQKKIQCKKFVIRSPKKPHSARRKTVWVSILSRITARLPRAHTACYIPGIGHSLQKFSEALMRGGRRRDIPGMKYTLIRGTKQKFGPPQGRRSRRSKYGVPQWMVK